MILVDSKLALTVRSSIKFVGLPVQLSDSLTQRLERSPSCVGPDAIPMKSRYGSGKMHLTLGRVSGGYLGHGSQ